MAHSFAGKITGRLLPSCPLLLVLGIPTIFLIIDRINHNHYESFLAAGYEFAGFAVHISFVLTFLFVTVGGLFGREGYKETAFVHGLRRFLKSMLQLLPQEGGHPPHREEREENE